MKFLPAIIAALLSSASFAQLSVNGPDAPDMMIQPSGTQLSITLSNSPVSNNYQLMYEEWDPLITNAPDSTLNFQGYIVYQLVDTTVLPMEDRHDPSKMRVVAQCDLADMVDTLINNLFDSTTMSCGSVLEVNGENTGIMQTMTIAQDAFTGTSFSNGTKYCFMVFAYAHNDYKDYPGCAPLKAPFYLGRRNVKHYCITPTTLGIAETGPNELSVVPNPSVGNVEIRVKGSNGGKVHITDVSGRLIRSESIDVRSVMVIGGISAGIYIVTYINHDGDVSRQKLLVNQQLGIM
jgi:hypothetical protein